MGFTFFWNPGICWSLTRSRIKVESAMDATISLDG